MSSEIKKTVEIDIKSNAEGSIGQLKDLKRQLKLVAAGSEEFKTLYNQIDDLEDKIKGSKKASSDWIDTLEQAGGPLGALGAGLNRAKVATQSFGGALKATGIGLVIALVAGLVGAFSENEKAMKKLQPLLIGLQKIFGGIFAAVEPLFNYLVDVAVQALPVVTKGIGLFYSAVFGLFTFVKEAGMGYLKVWKGILTLDFSMAKAGVMQMKDSFAIAVKAGEDTYKKFEEGTKNQTKIEKEELEKREKLAKEAQDKKDAADKKSKEAQIKKDEEEKKRALEILKQGQTLSDIDSTAAEDELALIDVTNQAKRDKDTTFKQDTLDAQVKFELDIAQTVYESEDARLQREIEMNDAKIKAKEDYYNAATGLVTDGQAWMERIEAAGIGRSKATIAIQKGLALTAIGIDTAKAFSTAVPMALKAGEEAAKAAGPAAPAAGPIATALSYAGSALMIIGNINKAKKILGAGGGADTGGGTSAPPSPQAQFNVVGASGTNQLAATIGRQQNQPIKAYVVGGDVTNQQSLDRARLNSATFL